jgi:hypothetical protein
MCRKLFSWLTLRRLPFAFHLNRPLGLIIAWETLPTRCKLEHDFNSSRTIESSVQSAQPSLNVWDWVFVFSSSFSPRLGIAGLNQCPPHLAFDLPHRPLQFKDLHTHFELCVLEGRDVRSAKSPSTVNHHLFKFSFNHTHLSPMVLSEFILEVHCSQMSSSSSTRKFKAFKFF